MGMQNIKYIVQLKHFEFLKNNHTTGLFIQSENIPEKKIEEKIIQEIFHGRIECFDAKRMMWLMSNTPYRKPNPIVPIVTHTNYAGNSTSQKQEGIYDLLHFAITFSGS